MKAAIDTSVLVAAFVVTHAHHKVALDWMNRAAQEKRSQWRVRFQVHDDGDDNPDHCTFKTGASAIAADKPRLTVTFDYP